MNFGSLILAEAAPAANAAATTTSTNTGRPMGGLMDMLPIIIVFGVMIFFMMRSQKKQQQKRQQMLDKIVKGSRVLLGSGMFGTIKEVRESSYVVTIADKVEVEVVKTGIADLAPQPGEAAKTENK